MPNVQFWVAVISTFLEPDLQHFFLICTPGSSSHAGFYVELCHVSSTLRWHRSNSMATCNVFFPPFFIIWVHFFLCVKLRPATKATVARGADKPWVLFFSFHGKMFSSFDEMPLLQRALCGSHSLPCSQLTVGSYSCHNQTVVEVLTLFLQRDCSCVHAYL